jgi:hypothetical protein
MDNIMTLTTDFPNMTIITVLSVLLFVGCISLAVSKMGDGEQMAEILGWIGLGVGFGLLSLNTVFPERRPIISFAFLAVMVISALLLFRGLR